MLCMYVAIMVLSCVVSPYTRWMALCMLGETQFLSYPHKTATWHDAVADNSCLAHVLHHGMLEARTLEKMDFRYPSGCVPGLYSEGPTLRVHCGVRDEGYRCAIL